MTRVLVTGGAGFIESCIVDQLVGRGAQVVVLDNLPPAAHGSRPGYLNAEADYIWGDVRDSAAWEQALEGLNAVCHQAGKVGLVRTSAMPRPTSTTTMSAGWSASQHCTGAGSLDASCSATKMHQGHLTAAFAGVRDVEACWLRYHNVYGPRMSRNTPYADVASIFRSALERGDAPGVTEGWQQRRNFVHVSDVANANVTALLADTPIVGAVDVGSGTPRSPLPLPPVPCCRWPRGCLRRWGRFPAMIAGRE